VGGRERRGDEGGGCVGGMGWGGGLSKEGAIERGEGGWGEGRGGKNKTFGRKKMLKEGWFGDMEGSRGAHGAVGEVEGGRVEGQLVGGEGR